DEYSESAAAHKHIAEGTPAGASCGRGRFFESAAETHLDLVPADSRAELLSRSLSLSERRDPGPVYPVQRGSRKEERRSDLQLGRGEHWPVRQADYVSSEEGSRA